MKFGESDGYLIQLEATPMSDIIFNLLLFFLLTASFAADTGFELALPKTVEPAALPQREVVVTLAPGDELLINEQRVNWGALEVELGRALERSEERLVVVRGDEHVSLGRVVEVMDAARRQGAQSLAIAAEPKEEPGRSGRR